MSLCRSVCLISSLPLLLLCTSCGKKAPNFKECVPVRGQVLYEGNPVPKGTRVVFHPVNEEVGPETILPRGEVGDDGSFVVSTYKFEDGAPAGAYTVTVLHFQKGRGMSHLLPEKYGDPATSGLQAQVGKRKTELPTFELVKDQSPMSEE
jgi:hypothetical protein